MVKSSNRRGLLAYFRFMTRRRVEFVGGTTFFHFLFSSAFSSIFGFFTRDIFFRFSSVLPAFLFCFVYRRSLNDCQGTALKGLELLSDQIRYIIGRFLMIGWRLFTVRDFRKYNRGTRLELSVSCYTGFWWKITNKAASLLPLRK